MEVIIITLILFLSILTLIVLYYGAISLVGSIAKEGFQRRWTPKTRFAVIVPAHNEELNIAQAVSSLLQNDYPSSLRDVFVIADNCSDATAEVARKCGVLCLERRDSKKGKGNALHWAFEQVPKKEFDAFIIMDADTTVEKSFLLQLDGDIQDGKKAIQGYDVTQNPDESWMTRLSDLSDVLQFRLYFRGRSRLRLSCRLLGNGMCFSKEIIERFGWDAFSITENWEYYMKITLGGYVVHYNPRARFFSQRAADFSQGKPQRLRWMAGRADVAKRYIPVLIMEGIKSRNIRKIDAALDFLLPSQSMLLSMLGLAFFLQFWVGSEVLLGWLMGITLLECAICGIGVIRGGLGFKSYIALFLAPVYIIWKLWLRALAIFAKQEGWIRTERRMPSVKRDVNSN